MFLTESYNVATNSYGITDDPATLLEATLEAQEEYQKLTETMVVLEHKAIVTENANLLSEAEAKFSQKVKDNVKKLGERILAFLEKCRAKAQEIALRIAAPLIKKYADSRKSMTKTKKEIELPSWYTTINYDVTNFIATTNTKAAKDLKETLTTAGDNTIVSSKDIENVIKELKEKLGDKIADGEKIAKKSDPSSYVDAAVKRCQNIKKILNVINESKKATMDAMAEAKKDTKDKKKASKISEKMVKFSRLMSLEMNIFFKVIGQDIKVLRACTTYKKDVNK